MRRIPPTAACIASVDRTPRGVGVSSDTLVMVGIKLFGYTISKQVILKGYTISILSKHRFRFNEAVAAGRQDRDKPDIYKRFMPPL